MPSLWANGGTKPGDQHAPAHFLSPDSDKPVPSGGPMSSPVDSTEPLAGGVLRFPRGRLSVAKGPDKGAEVMLDGQTVVLGSGEGCDLKLTDPAVSRRHVELS